MINNVSKVHLDRDATKENIKQLAQKKGLSIGQFYVAVQDFTTKYKEAAKRDELYEIDEYSIMAQVLNVSLDELFVIAEG